MSNGKLENDFIEFASDLELLTNDVAVKNIYVRESYKTLTTLIADAMIKEGIKGFVVTGTPGIGKTIYLHYFLWLLLKRQTNINDQVDRKIYLQRSSRVIHSFQGDRVVAIDSMTAETTVLYDKNCILLVDMVEENEPILCSGTTIIFSSPNPKRYKQFVNRHSRRFILNCWTLEELKAVWLKSYTHIPWKDVKKVFDKVGGVIRYVLELHKDADDSMEEGILQARNMFMVMSKNINQQISFGDGLAMVYRVVHILSTDHSFKNSKFVFASNYARNEYLKGLKLEEIDLVMALLKFNTGIEYGGTIFESQVHKFVAEFGLQKITRLDNVKYKYDEIISNSSPRSFALPDDYELVCYSAASKIPTKFSNNAAVKIEKDVYYQPNKRNFPSIDSFLIKDNDVFAFQITVGGKKDGIKASGLQKLYEIVSNTFPNMSYHIVFLCPVGEKNPLDFKAVKILKKTKVYAHYKDIPEEVQRFEGNQWFSIINLQTSYEKDRI